jgi:AmmeMemoRadiSam system protein B
MINKLWPLWLLGLFSLGSLGIIFGGNSQPIHPLVFFDKETFYAGVEWAGIKDEGFKNHASGGIIPHHLFPGFIIADFFSRLAKQHPKTIIVIGPDHFERGNYQAVSSLYGWETPFGVVEPETAVTGELVKNRLVKIDEDVLAGDHSAAGIMPFIKYYIPDAKVVPILISGFTTEAEARLLADGLKDYLRDEETVMVAAVDFSHYLTSSQAQEKDKITLAAMKNFAYKQLFSLNNDYLDSPAAVATLLMTMRAVGATEMELLYHTNSGELLRNGSIETTSYFSMAYHVGPQFKPTGLSIDKAFSEDHIWTASLSAARKRVMMVTGDVNPARSVNSRVTKLNNFKWPYQKTAEVLEMADATFINLETPLIPNCPVTDTGFKFCGSDKNVEGLVFAGVDIVSLANNHAGNYGLGGISSTVDLLTRNGMMVTGLNGPVYYDIRGLKFAFLGYNDIGYSQAGVSWADENKISSEITEAKKNADIVVVMFHWGGEYRHQPDDRQRFLGHLAIDAGADLIVGNHPHWIQPVEIYKQKLIAYGHGNFVFDQEWSLKTKQGVVGKYTFYDNHLVDAEFLPVQIKNYGQPDFLTGDAGRRILESARLGSKDLVDN